MKKYLMLLALIVFSAGQVSFANSELDGVWALTNEVACVDFDKNELVENKSVSPRSNMPVRRHPKGFLTVEFTSTGDAIGNFEVNADHNTARALMIQYPGLWPLLWDFGDFEGCNIVWDKPKGPSDPSIRSCLLINYVNLNVNVKGKYVHKSLDNPIKVKLTSDISGYMNYFIKSDKLYLDASLTPSDSGHDPFIRPTRPANACSGGKQALVLERL